MRVVGGEYRSRTLLQFSGEDIRPTADKVKESLFNILGVKIYGCLFLDLFSGTGAMGIEAISRGAKDVVFVDGAKSSCVLTDANLKRLKIDNKAVLNDSIAFLKRDNKKYDIIFIDPPYKTDLGIKALKVIDEKDNLAKNAIVVYENETPFDQNILFNTLEKYDERKYGRVYLTFFRRKL